MRFVFATDLHGMASKYIRLGTLAAKYGAEAIVIGGDISTKLVSKPFEQQAKFYKWLRRWADRQLIPVFTHLGNDDYRALLPVFEAECSKARNLFALQPLGTVHGHTYMRYNYIPDTPFGLKDWCRYDTTSFVPEPYYCAPVLSEKCAPGFRQSSYRFKDIAVPVEYFKGLPTIEQDLAQIEGPLDLAFIHSPPAGLGLDVCIGGRAVGSKAVLQWIQRVQPTIVMCGHIHESIKMTGLWRAPVGRTLVVQPGDDRCVVVDITPEQKVDVQLVEF